MTSRTSSMQFYTLAGSPESEGSPFGVWRYYVYKSHTSRTTLAMIRATKLMSCKTSKSPFPPVRPQPALNPARRLFLFTTLFSAFSLSSAARLASFSALSAASTLGTVPAPSRTPCCAPAIACPAI